MNEGDCGIYYGVRVGAVPGVYDNWYIRFHHLILLLLALTRFNLFSSIIFIVVCRIDANKQVCGYGGAVFKKFKTYELALAFVNKDRVLPRSSPSRSLSPLFPLGQASPPPEDSQSSNCSSSSITSPFLAASSIIVPGGPLSNNPIPVPSSSPSSGHSSSSSSTSSSH
jgi:hypothetical protein